MKDKLREILRCVYRRGLQRNLGKKTLSLDQAQEAITKLFLERLPERKEFNKVIGLLGTGVGKREAKMIGFNQAIDQIRKEWGDEG